MTVRHAGPQALAAERSSVTGEIAAFRKRETDPSRLSSISTTTGEIFQRVNHRVKEAGWKEYKSQGG